jgi:hypothetical protein
LPFKCLSPETFVDLVEVPRSTGQKKPPPRHGSAMSEVAENIGPEQSTLSASIINLPRVVPSKPAPSQRLDWSASPSKSSRSTVRYLGTLA